MIEYTKEFKNQQWNNSEMLDGSFSLMEKMRTDPDMYRCLVGHILDMIEYADNNAKYKYQGFYTRERSESFYFDDIRVIGADINVELIFWPQCKSVDIKHWAKLMLRWSSHGLSPICL